MHQASLLFAAVLLFGLTGCGPPPPEDRQSEAAARADSVAMAALSFDETAFDTIVWESEDAADDRGRLVYSISCSKCHGPSGRGDGDFLFQGDTLRPPSFVAPEWGFADAPLELRRYIFSGSVIGMPYWGLVGLEYRDIDAVASFISGPLRDGTITP